MHGGAGLLTPIFVISWFSAYLYLFTSIIVSFLAFVKGVGYRLIGKRYFLIGAICILVFANVADSIQSKVDNVVLYGGIAILTIMTFIVILLAAVGINKGVSIHEA